MEKEGKLENRNARQKEDGDENRNYDKNLTILVEIEGEDRITMMELLKKVSEECGAVIGCRYKTPRQYELTMQHEKGKEKILDGIKIKNSRVMTKEICGMEMVVSFLGLPTYIEDEEIIRKLTEWGVTAVSRIKRRMWAGTDIADGTRFLKVKFTDTVKSLPYSTKFETMGGTEHIRVIHDRQVKVCRLCIQPGHIVRECLNFKCYKCGKQGHYARECKEGNCNECEMRPALCVCKKLPRMRDDNSEGESSDLYENDDEEENEEDEVSAYEEDGRKDTWCGEEGTSAEPAFGGAEEKEGGKLELGKKTISKAENGKSQKQQKIVEEDREKMKSGRESQVVDNTKSKEIEPQSMRQTQVKIDGEKEEIVIKDSQRSSDGEEMDTCQEISTKKKRKKEMEEHKRKK